MNTAIRTLLVSAIVLSLAACAGKKKEIAPPAEQTTTNPQTNTMPTDPDADFKAADALERVPCLQNRVVYFDLDATDVRGEFSETLACHAKYLSYHPTARLTLEGHADERGTREYNLGLGERRGNAVRDMLNTAGGSSDQSSTTSYGEERPTCQESSEDCWSKNRRVELVYTAK
jgi:peptidoglycan-associated lipoprotein